MITLRGIRDRDADLLGRCWRGDDLLSDPDRPGWPVDLPRPGRRSVLLAADGIGVVHLADIEYVHRRARLTVAVLDPGRRASMLASAVALAVDRLRLRRLYGYLPAGDPAENILYQEGFVAELTIPEHGLLAGRPVPRTVWGWVA